MLLTIHTKTGAFGMFLVHTGLHLSIIILTSCFCYLIKNLDFVSHWLDLKLLHYHCMALILKNYKITHNLLSIYIFPTRVSDKIGKGWWYFTITGVSTWHCCFQLTFLSNELLNLHFCFVFASKTKNKYILYIYIYICTQVI